MERGGQPGLALCCGGSRVKRKKQEPLIEPSQAQKDLVIIVADKNISSAVSGILDRPESLGIRQVDYEIHVHPERDPGCRARSVELLNLYLNSCKHALVIFDRVGCGQDQATREQLEADVTKELQKNGWIADRADVIVIDPELENWVWSDSPHVASELGWTNQPMPLREWLQRGGFLADEQTKPARPKEAMEAVLKKVRKPRSSAIYYALAKAVSFGRCQDPSFLKLKVALKSWFAPIPSA